MLNKERAPRPALPSRENAPRPSQQFRSAPRFTSTPRPNPSQVLRSTPAASRYLTPGARAGRKELDVIDVSADGDPEDLLQSIETGQEDPDIAFTSGELEEDGVGKRIPKRRRLSDSVEVEDDLPLELVKHEENEDQELEEDLLSSLPILSSPPAPHRRPISTTAPRFLLSTPAPYSTPGPAIITSNTQAFLKPPRFKPPDPTEPAETHGDPLPDQFSPHRKGQKYVPGGLASEMRDLLMNIESTTSAKALGNQKKENEWQVKLVIDEVNGSERSGLTLIRGRQLHSMDDGIEVADTIGFMKIALAGEGAATGLQRGSKVEAGRHVGIKGPMWEILLEGEKWGVGVNWKVL